MQHLKLLDCQNDLLNFLLRTWWSTASSSTQKRGSKRAPVPVKTPQGMEVEIHQVQPMTEKSRDFIIGFGIPCRLKE